MSESGPARRTGLMLCVYPGVSDINRWSLLDHHHSLRSDNVERNLMKTYFNTVIDSPGAYERTQNAFVDSAATAFLCL